MVDIRFKVRNYDKSRTFITLRIKNFIKTYEMSLGPANKRFEITFRIIGNTNWIDYVIFGEPYYISNNILTKAYKLRNEYRGKKYIYEGMDKDDEEKYAWGIFNFVYELLFRRDIRVIRLKNY